MAKEPSTKAKPKKSDRDVFSLQNGVKSKKKSDKSDDKSTKKKFHSDDAADEQMSEIRKISMQTINAKKKLLTVKNIKRQGRVSYESLVTGTVVGCRVTQVHTDRIIVSLPYRMRGYIPLTHISSHYTKLMHQVAAGKSTNETAMTLPQLYTPGQWLTAAVANSPANEKPKSGLLLSLYPSDVSSNSVNCTMVKAGVVLQCAVISVEDHGYTLDTGVRGVTAAFLPTKELPTDLDIGVGSVVTCEVLLVGGSKEAVTLTMTADADKVAAAVSKPSDTKTGLTLPGMTVQGVVTVSSTESLTLHLGTEEEYYDLLECESTEMQWKVGIISRIHLRSSFDQCHFFRTGQKLLPKVLFTTNFPRTVYLTLNKAAFNYDLTIPYEPSNGLDMNSVTDGTVFSCSDEGVTVKLPNNCSGFCFSNQAAGKGVTATISNLKEKFPIGKRVACKPVAYNNVDNVFIVIFNVSAESPSDQAAAVMAVGDVSLVTILEYNESGAKVRTKTGVDGFVRKNHITDSNMSNPEQKYPCGTCVKAKVIQISENLPGVGKQKLSVYFSLKTKFLKSSLPVISEYAEDAIGKETMGIIKSVFLKRFFVALSSNVNAVVKTWGCPQNAIIKDSYEVGQVIQLKIVELGKTLDGSAPLFIACIPMAKKDIVKNINGQHWLSSIKNTIEASKEITEEKSVSKLRMKRSQAKLPTKKRSMSKERSLSTKLKRRKTSTLQ